MTTTERNHLRQQVDQARRRKLLDEYGYRACDQCGGVYQPAENQPTWRPQRFCTSACRNRWQRAQGAAW